MSGSSSVCRILVELGRPLGRERAPTSLALTGLLSPALPASNAATSQVELSGDNAKATKRRVNTKWNYPPPATRQDTFKAAEWPRRVDC